MAVRVASRVKQPGEPGTTRRPVDDPDEVIGLEPRACAGCGGGLADVFTAVPGEQVGVGVRRSG